MRIEVGDRFSAGDLGERDHFLTARWVLFSAAGGRRRFARACHEPWPLHRARVLAVDDQLVTAAGLPPPQGEPLAHYSPGVDVRIGLFDGYLTVSFDGPHFHLCIGENKGSPKDPTPEALKNRRRPSKAQIFRRLDRDGAPISWGFEMFNGDKEPMISIFFASPFLSAGDKVCKEPMWERLSMWRDLAERYLGRPAEEFDQSGRGYAGGGH